MSLELDCKIESNTLVGGVSGYEVATQYNAIQIKLIEPTGTLQILAELDNGIVDITRAETQSLLRIVGSTIMYSNYNDHDVPEEDLLLIKSDTGYAGVLTSRWDAIEELKLTCSEK
jgi:hypothetical protein